MRKLIPIIVLVLIAVSSNAFALTVLSIDADSFRPIPYADVAIFIGGSAWETCTNANGEYTFTYPDSSEIPWTSYVTKYGWSWFYPVNGYMTTSISVTVHRHYLIM
jgi:hypothetical protein